MRIILLAVSMLAGPGGLRPLQSAAPTIAARLQVTQAQRPAAALPSIERRYGPYVFSDGLTPQTFTVVVRSVRLPGKNIPDDETVTAVEFVDTAGVVQYRENFAYEVKNGEFTETCSVSVEHLAGSMGKGVLLDTGCLPSAPLSAGPWSVFGIVKGKLTRFGKPVYAEGELGRFVPGPIVRIGPQTRISADQIQIRVFTGYFFVTVPVAVNWLDGKLGLAQHCFYQTGRGMAEGGCELPAEDVGRHPDDRELTFVRMFRESNEASTGPATHVVVKKTSAVEVLGSKVLVTWNEASDSVALGVDDDIWVKVRIDGQEGWIHTEEDLQAIGLYRAG
jgi:hypothetical protein